MTWPPVLDHIEARAYKADLRDRPAWSRRRDNRRRSTGETAPGGPGLLVRGPAGPRLAWQGGGGGPSEGEHDVLLIIGGTRG